MNEIVQFSKNESRRIVEFQSQLTEVSTSAWNVVDSLDVNESRWIKGPPSGNESSWILKDVTNRDELYNSLCFLRKKQQDESRVLPLVNESVHSSRALNPQVNRRFTACNWIQFKYRISCLNMKQMNNWTDVCKWTEISYRMFENESAVQKWVYV